MKITFASPQALSVFRTMAEGMSELQEDNGFLRIAGRTDRLVAMLILQAPAAASAYPWSIELGVLTEPARDVLASCHLAAPMARAQNLERLHPGDVVISS